MVSDSLKIRADNLKTGNLPQEHEARFKNCFVLPLQAIQMALGQTCYRALCQCPWWGFEHQFCESQFYETRTPLTK